MTSTIFHGLLPLIILGAGIVVVMLQIAWRRHAGITLGLALVTLIMAIAVLSQSLAMAPLEATPLLMVDGLSRLMSLVLLLGALATLLLADRWLQWREAESGEFSLLLLLATLGTIVMVHSQHAASFVLGLEILGVSMYTLIAYPQRHAISVEAGLKYLVLSSASTGMLLFGMALLYAATGALAFTEVGQQLTTADSVLTTAATVLMVAGIAFKLSLVPFHMWTPDVYEGAPTPVTGFLATASKVALIAVIIRWFTAAGLGDQAVVNTVLSTLAIASMVVGNVLALYQDNVKRLLGYSSIAHMGYLLIAVVLFRQHLPEDLAVHAAVWYLIAYTASTLAAFAALTLVASETDDVPKRSDLTGFLWRRPLPGLLLMAALLSLAGVPLTVGFMGKFYLVTASVAGHAWYLLAALVFGSAVSVFYYLRLIYTLISQDHGENSAQMTTPWLSRVAVVGLLASILVLGVLPGGVAALLVRIL